MKSIYGSSRCLLGLRVNFQLFKKWKLQMKHILHILFSVMLATSTTYANDTFRCESKVSPPELYTFQPDGTVVSIYTGTKKTSKRYYKVIFDNPNVSIFIFTGNDEIGNIKPDVYYLGTTDKQKRISMAHQFPGNIQLAEFNKDSGELYSHTVNSISDIAHKIYDRKGGAITGFILSKCTPLK
jgi:hypothetical protein